MSGTRRYELDWLRVIAFTVLIYFHAAIFFVPFGLPLIQNAEIALRLTGDVFHRAVGQRGFIKEGEGVINAKRLVDPAPFVAIPM